jgi:hypothetical protein
MNPMALFDRQLHPEFVYAKATNQAIILLHYTIRNPTKFNQFFKTQNFILL